MGTSVGTVNYLGLDHVMSCMCVFLVTSSFGTVWHMVSASESGYQAGD